MICSFLVVVHLLTASPAVIHQCDTISCCGSVIERDTLSVDGNSDLDFPWDDSPDSSVTEKDDGINVVRTRRGRIYIDRRSLLMEIFTGGKTRPGFIKYRKHK